MRFIILRAADMLRVACTCICYAVMLWGTSRLPVQYTHRSLPQPRQGQNSKYVPVKPPTVSTCSAKTKIPFYILLQKHFSSCPALLLLLFVVDPLLTYSTHSLVTSDCLIIISPVLWGCFITTTHQHSSLYNIIRTCCNQNIRTICQ